MGKNVCFADRQKLNTILPDLKKNAKKLRFKRLKILKLKNWR